MVQGGGGVDHDLANYQRCDRADKSRTCLGPGLLQQKDTGQRTTTLVGDRGCYAVHVSSELQLQERRVQA